MQNSVTFQKRSRQMGVFYFISTQCREMVCLTRLLGMHVYSATTSNDVLAECEKQWYSFSYHVLNSGLRNANFATDFLSNRASELADTGLGEY